MKPDLKTREPSKPSRAALAAKRLAPGDMAPDFVAKCTSGKPVTLGAVRGQRVWLALFRFAACPFCNWRVHRMVRRQDEIRAAGITLLAVFPSSRARCEKYIERYDPTFTIVADPEEALYTLYHSERSIKGELKTLVNLPKVVRALATAPNNPLAADGPLDRMPAEFLVGPTGRIDRALYGTSLDDGFEIDEVLAWAGAAPQGSPGAAVPARIT